MLIDIKKYTIIVLIIIGFTIAIPISLFAKDAKPNVIHSDYLSRADYAGIDLPIKINDFNLGIVTDYRRKNPGLGVSVSYLHTEYTTTIYFYDNNSKFIPSRIDLNNPQHITLLLQPDISSSLEIKELVKRGVYSKVKEKGVNGSPKNTGIFTCSGYDIEKNKTDFDSYLCLTMHNNKFIKVRMSMPARKDSTKIVSDFLNEFYKNFK